MLAASSAMKTGEKWNSLLNAALWIETKALYTRLCPSTIFNAGALPCPCLSDYRTTKKVITSIIQTKIVPLHYLCPFIHISIDVETYLHTTLCEHVYDTRWYMFRWQNKVCRDLAQWRWNDGEQSSEKMKYIIFFSFIIRSAVWLDFCCSILL